MDVFNGRRCYCLDGYYGENCGGYRIGRINRIKNIFEDQIEKGEIRVTDDRFYFIAVVVFMNTLITLFGIFVSYRKTKRNVSPQMLGNTESGKRLMVESC